LVPAVPGFLSLLPEQTTAACGAGGFDQYSPHVGSAGQKNETLCPRFIGRGNLTFAAFRIARGSKPYLRSLGAIPSAAPRTKDSSRNRRESEHGFTLVAAKSVRCRRAEKCERSETYTFTFTVSHLENGTALQSIFYKHTKGT
jgi:hypothetical protein